jgi:hypothetical protein
MNIDREKTRLCSPKGTDHMDPKDIAEARPSLRHACSPTAEDGFPGPILPPPPSSTMSRIGVRVNALAGDAPRENKDLEKAAERDTTEEQARGGGAGLRPCSTRLLRLPYLRSGPTAPTPSSAMSPTREHGAREGGAGQRRSRREAAARSARVQSKRREGREQGSRTRWDWCQPHE